LDSTANSPGPAGGVLEINFADSAAWAISKSLFKGEATIKPNTDNVTRTVTARLKINQAGAPPEPKDIIAAATAKTAAMPNRASTLDLIDIDAPRFCFQRMLLQRRTPPQGEGITISCASAAKKTLVCGLHSSPWAA